MAHNIQHTEQGDAMFCVGDRNAAWHKLGQRTDAAVSWKEAVKLALLDWTVTLQPVHYFSTSDATTPLEMDGNFVVTRSTDNAALGVVGKNYRPIQNRDAFEFVDAILQAENGSHYESAGALGNGERVWCLARIPSADFTIGANDKHELYVCFTTSHDGSKAAECLLTDVRVVCQNTLQAALSGKDAKAFMRIRHTKSGLERMEAAKKLVADAVVDATTLRAKFETLVSRRMTKKTFMTIVDELFPVETDPKKLEESAALRAKVTRREKIMSEIIDCYNRNDDNAFPEQKGTAYNFLNAVTEWVDHHKSVNERGGLSSEQNRAKQAMFGVGADFKAKALKVILAATKPETDDGGGVAVATENHQDFIDNTVENMLKGL